MGTYIAERLDLLLAINFDLERIVYANVGSLALNVRILEKFLLERRILGSHLTKLVNPLVDNCVREPLDFTS